MRHLVLIRALWVLALCSIAVSASGENLAQGGSFDSESDLDFWPGHGPLAQWDAEDAFGDPKSGSVEVANIFDPGVGSFIFQCVSVIGGNRHAFGAYGKIPIGPENAVFLQMRVRWFAGDDCTAGVLSFSPAAPEVSSVGTWQLMEGDTFAPFEAKSATVDIITYKTEADPPFSVAGLFDDVFLSPLCSRDIDCEDGDFCNGFERCNDAGACEAGPTCESQDPTLVCSESQQACVVQWNADFQGDSNHAGVLGQNDPVDFSEPGVLWNAFEVQALNSVIASDSVTDPFTKFASAGAAPLEALMMFEGEVIGFAGEPGRDALFGDYLLLTDDYGVDSSVIDWELVLPMKGEYELLFTFNDDKDPDRSITFDIEDGDSAAQVGGAVALAMRAEATAEGVIRGTATGEPGGEGHWSGLQITSVPERRWLVDFHGDEDHRSLFGQTNPGLSNATEVWNSFDVQAFNSTSASDFQTDGSLDLVDDHGADLGVTMAFQGDMIGWSGSPGADPVAGDYLLLVNAFGVNTNVIDWQLSGLRPSSTYRLTFLTGGDGATTRAVLFEVGSQDLTLRNVDESGTLDVISDGAGQIAAKATNAGSFEGNWAGLEIEFIPEPSSTALSASALLTLLYMARRSRIRTG